MRHLPVLLAGLILLHAPARADISKEDAFLIGSYPYFAGLDMRCGAPTKERGEALDSLKKQTLHNARSAFAMAKKISKNDLQGLEKIVEGEKMIEKIEREGPLPDQLKRVNGMLDQLKPAEVAELCSTFSADIAKQMELLKLLMQTNEMLNKNIDKIAQ